MKKALVLGFGFLSYALFLGVFLYMIGFIGDFYVPRTLQHGPPNQDTTVGLAMLINMGLILLFGLQHSVMARPGFKRWLTRWIHPAIERSTYMLLSSLAMMLLMFQWRPIEGMLWDLRATGLEPYAWGVFGFGWLFLLASTWMINHFDLFGLRQVVLYAREQENRPLPYAERMFYKFSRHPIYLGWLLVSWCVPSMSVGHLIYASGMTLYILVAIPFEERDLIGAFGDHYRDYRERVPTLLGRRSQDQPRDAQAQGLEPQTRASAR